MKWQLVLASGVLASVLAFEAPTARAQAKIDFALYEGAPVIKTGTGGTKITKNGIDWWTTGEPPRRYQVIAAVQDKRDEMWDGGHALGSPSIASKVKKAGGDAVILLSQDEAGKGGGYGSGTGAFAFLFSGGSKTISKMIVVKYLPDVPPTTEAPTPPAPPPSTSAEQPSP